jgi:hypothetical protein
VFTVPKPSNGCLFQLSHHNVLKHQRKFITLNTECSRFYKNKNKKPNIVADLLNTIKIFVFTFIEICIQCHMLSLVLSPLEDFEIPFLNITAGELP